MDESFQKIQFELPTEAYRGKNSLATGSVESWQLVKISLQGPKVSLLAIVRVGGRLRAIHWIQNAFGESPVSSLPFPFSGKTYESSSDGCGSPSVGHFRGYVPGIRKSGFWTCILSHPSSLRTLFLYLYAFFPPFPVLTLKSNYPVMQTLNLSYGFLPVRATRGRGGRGGIFETIRFFLFLFLPDSSRELWNDRDFFGNVWRNILTASCFCL